MIRDLLYLYQGSLLWAPRYQSSTVNRCQWLQLLRTARHCVECEVLVRQVSWVDGRGPQIMENTTPHCLEDPCHYIPQLSEYQ